MKILLVDDHAVVRRGIREILEDGVPGARCAEAGCAREALAAVDRERYDIVILDISLPGRGGMEVLEEIRRREHPPPVLVFSMHAEDVYSVHALRAGASGYLTKGCAAEDLIEAVRKVASGGRYVGPKTAEHLAVHLSTESARPPHDALSAREFEVLRLIGAGKSVKEVAADLGLSDKTVSTYRARVLDKLAMRSTGEMIRYAVRIGLLD